MNTEQDTQENQFKLAAKMFFYFFIIQSNQVQLSLYYNYNYLSEDYLELVSNCVLAVYEKINILVILGDLIFLCQFEDQDSVIQIYVRLFRVIQIKVIVIY